MPVLAASWLVSSLAAAPPAAAVSYRDVAVESGLVGVNTEGGAEKRYLIEETGGGVGLVDYDGDGRLDVFLPGGGAFDRDGKVRPGRHYLYRNLGQLRFEDVTEKAGLDAGGWAQGVCAGDYDNDGDVDLHVTHYGHSVLHRNDGRGRFEDVSEAAGVRARETRWDTGCSFFDYDGDGDLDLVVAGYMQLDPARIPAPGANNHCAWRGIPVACGPRGVPQGRPRLLRNEGARFRDVSIESGVGKAERCYGFGVVVSDFDNDAFPDVYIACDSSPSLLLRNRHDGTFEEMGVLSGTALNEEGHEQGGMGVDAGDVDEDGLVDIVKTNFSDDVPNLYLNVGDLSFEDRVHEAGLGKRPTILGWGVHLIDADHDGLRDVLMVNGHIYPEADRLPQYGFRQTRLLYRNTGSGTFDDVTASAGPGIATTEWSSRGSAVGDLDDDGTLEVVIANLGARPSLLKNIGRPKNWLAVRCMDAGRDAIGARVVVSAGGRRVSREVQSGSGYLSQSAFQLHFGLGDRAEYDQVEVRWPGGAREVFPGGPANRLVMLARGASERQSSGAGR